MKTRDEEGLIILTEAHEQELKNRIINAKKQCKLLINIYLVAKRNQFIAGMKYFLFKKLGLRF